MGHAAALGAHLVIVAVSVSLFSLRCALMMAGLPRWQARWLRILPHAVDTALLASGVWLMLLTRQFPFVNAWLSVKLLLVVAYIVLGNVALRRGATLRIRTLAAVAALLTIGWIILVALARDPLGPAAFLS